MARSAKRQRTELHSRAEGKRRTVELRHRSERYSIPTNPTPGGGRQDLGARQGLTVSPIVEKAQPAPTHLHPFAFSAIQL